VRLFSRYLVYPDGDRQEISHTLHINEVVDLNGIPLSLPLPTAKILAYRVRKISTREEIGEEITFYHLELLHRDDLIEYT